MDLGREGGCTFRKNKKLHVHSESNVSYVRNYIIRIFSKYIVFANTRYV